jgi:L-rhamnose mutarotase
MIKQEKSLSISDELSEKLEKIADNFSFKVNVPFDNEAKILEMLDLLSRCTDNYFKSEESKYIFALVETDGKVREKMLNISLSLYEDKEAAKKWRSQIAKIVHPDTCTLPNAEKAMVKLNELYEGMTKDEQ